MIPATHSPPPGLSSRSHAVSSVGLLTMSLVGFYALLVAAGCTWGHLPISLECLWAIVCGNPDVPAVERLVVVEVRLPQMLLVGLVGAALAGSGAALQATFANPLADPGLLGVTGGAALATVVVVQTGWADYALLVVPLAGFVGAIVAAVLVFTLAGAITAREVWLSLATPLTPRSADRFDLASPMASTHLLLAGLVVASLTGAAVSLVLINTTQTHLLARLVASLFGDFRWQTWPHVALATPGVVLGLVMLLVLGRRLDALALGGEAAAAIGLPVMATRCLVMAAAALAVGSATAVAGPVGFVGLMVPHLARAVAGATARRLLPVSMAGGAVLLTACELAARLLADRFTLPVGVLMAALGGPFLIALIAARPHRQTL